MADVHAILADWLRAEFVAEQEAGFPLLTQVPDTRVIRFLDHFAGLGRDSQAALVEILVEWSSHNLLGTQPNPCYERYQKATAFPDHVGGLRYTDVNLLSGLAKDANHGGLLGFFQSQGIKGLALEPPRSLVTDFADLVPVGVPALRKAVNAKLAKLFAPKLTDIGSEMWLYEGVLHNCQVKLRIQFSGRMGRPQMSYSTELRGTGCSIESPNFCFESMLGVGFGRWNYLTKENADRSLSVFIQLIERIARLPARLPL
jgi:hypothetical protein